MLMSMRGGDPSSVQNHRDQIPLLHVLRSGYDLHPTIFRHPGVSHAVFSHIHLTDDQFIRARMGFDLLNPADDNLLQILIKPCISLRLRSKQRHTVEEITIRAIQIRYVCFNP